MRASAATSGRLAWLSAGRPSGGLTFALGGASALVAPRVHGALAPHAIAPFGATEGAIAVVTLTLLAPLIEEHLKPAGAYALALVDEAPQEADYARLGALSGLGFAVVELAQYARVALVTLTGGALVVWLCVRFIVTGALHAACSALAAKGVARGRRTGRTVRAYASGIVPAVGLHAAYNLGLLLAIGAA